MKLAIFDLDGTLINSLEDIAAAANYSLGKLGLPVHELEKYNYFVGDGLNELIHRILPSDKQDKSEQALEIYKDYYNTHYMVKTRVYEGIGQLLDNLKDKGIKLAVASNKTDIFTQNVVKHYFKDNIFSIICGRTENRPVKPDPAIIQYIMDSLNVKAEDCFMIGDTNIDIKTGKNAGIKTIGCLWGFRTLEELRNAGADFIAHKPDDIPDFICD